MPDDEVKDRILLRRAIYQKERKALVRLHSIYYPRKKRYITSGIDSVPDAEDLTQGVFFELYKSEGTYREYQDAEAYLFGITKNLIALYYRSQRSYEKRPMFTEIPWKCRSFIPLLTPPRFYSALYRTEMFRYKKCQFPTHFS
ncbi:MAG: hypothetical protein JSW47_11830 [Phycisphaerales bacterium]|nr:MAG: hypothetical protein JSW47_11830 [Phycisphaerales bacterium]